MLNWSLTGGDLRIAHLVGLHALQILPLAGYLTTRWTRVPPREALALVGIVGVLYTDLTAVTLVLALLGTSFVSAPIILWLSPSVVAGVLLILTVSGFVLGTTLWARGTAFS